MSGRGVAPAPLADPVALLAPGADSFFFADRDERVIAAREPIADSGFADPAASFFLGLAPFESAPTHADFTPYRTVARAEGVAPLDAPSIALRGALDDDVDRARWRALVERALGAIAGGAASKIVLARRVRLHSDDAIDTQALAIAMMRAHGTYRYLLRRGDVLFAGASPEQLVQKRGDVVRTEAVAGTAPAEHDGTPLDLREKDQREHLAVVLAIEQALAPLTLALEHAEHPLVRTHGGVSHLVTPFDGRVDPATHVLAIAAALHPTPAVAGTPRDVALDFIARHEDMRRGWYAGPVGWFDRHGDGELAVALRCVRIEARAVDLYAGAGIVAGSDPDAEFDETMLKMRSTLASLGFRLSA